MTVEDKDQHFFVSSKNFQNKIKIPLRARYCVHPDTYYHGELLVSRHNGIFWKKSVRKECVLLKSGRLFIYSSLERGLSLNLSEIQDVRERYLEKSLNNKNRYSQCEMVLTKNNMRLRIVAKDQRPIVTIWRRGIMCAHNGILLTSANDTDEFQWSRPDVDPFLSDELLETMAGGTLKYQTSTATLPFASLPAVGSTPRYCELVSQMKQTTQPSLDHTFNSFYSSDGSDDNLESTIENTLEDDNLEKSSILSKSSGIIFDSCDSGVASPDGETLQDWLEENNKSKTAFSRESQITVVDRSTDSERKTSRASCKEVSETWKTRSRFYGLPLFNSEDLDLSVVCRISADLCV